MKPEQLVKKITELIFEKKGTDVKLINLQPVTTVADYFIICSADSDTQVKAIADNVDKSLRDEGIKLWHKEGYSSLNWVLLDYVDVVVHVFKHESRLFYNLEKLWGDAPVESLEDPKLKKPRKRTTKKVIVSPGEIIEK
ncbi:MAG: ribosome silencing factor [Ignavibacteria bacterium]|nr:ribosome silencing factor [Ignavibacteria bacterium]